MCIHLTRRQEYNIIHFLCTIKDIEIETPHQNRICYFDSKLGYLEFRAKQLDPSDTRECFLTSVYLNVYFVNSNTKEVMVNQIDLDKILG